MSGEAASAAETRDGSDRHGVGTAVFAAVFFMIFAGVFFGASQFSAEAALFPRLISLIAMTSAAIICVQSVQKARLVRRVSAAPPDKTARQSWRDITISYAGPPLYCALMAVVGFWIASAIFLGGLLVMLGTRRAPVVVAIIVGTLSSIYVAFDLIFGIELPGGMLLAATGS